MELQYCSWLLPNAAWQLIFHYLSKEDLLAARLACRAWRTDVGAFISVATVIPSQLLQLHVGGTEINNASSSDVNAASCLCDDAVLQLSAKQQLQQSPAASSERPGQNSTPEAVPDTSAVDTKDGRAACERAIESEACASVQPQQHWQPAGPDFSTVLSLLEAFPHCELVHVDSSCHAEQQLAAAVINALAGHSTSNGSATGVEGCPLGKPSAKHQFLNDGLHSHCSQLPAQTCCNDSHWTAADSKTPRPQLSLDVLQRSYHCLARQEYPIKPGSGREVFEWLQQLPRQLSPAGLRGLVTVQLDVFPECPAQWGALQQLPWLRELILPFFKPAVPYEHLLSLAKLEQLEALTLSVQGSITSWHANCAAFAALGQLRHLQKLSLHAFHCPGTQLAAALLCMSGLSELRLSGRVVLEPLSGLAALTKLQVFELTQDLQYCSLCDLVRQLPGITQLAVGRVTLPAAAAAEVGGPAAVWNLAQHAAAGMAWQPAAAAAAAPIAVGGGNPPPAAGADGADGGGNEDAGGVVVPPAAAADEAPANAEAAAVVVAADGDGVAAAAAAGGEGGVGEVMLEDVGAIVDGLIGNLQDGAVPVHLQRIIERFESIIQLDLTRRAVSSPWGWPVAGLQLLHELGLMQQQQRSMADRRIAGGARTTSSSSNGGGAGGCCSSFELALLRPADVVRLHELPGQLRGCLHLGLRLRDQLLAFASVCPVRLVPGELSTLGLAFRNLACLNLCGKIALDGDVLVELCQGLAQAGAGTSTAAAAAARSAPSAGAGMHTAADFRAAQLSAAIASSSSSSSSGSCQQHDAMAAVCLPGAVAAESSERLARTGLVCLCLDCHFVAVTAEHISAAFQQLQSLKVVSLRHRGGGKLPVPLSALPKTLTTLAAKKVLLYHEQRHSTCTGIAQLRDQQQQQQHVVVPTDAALDCHTITSPTFSSGSNVLGAGSPAALSAAPSAADLPSLAGGPAGEPSYVSNALAGGSSSFSGAGGIAEQHPPVLPNVTVSSEGLAGCVCCPAALPHLTGLFLKNSIVSNNTLQMLLGVCPATASYKALTPAGGSSSSHSSRLGVCDSGSCAKSCPLFRLSVTGDNATQWETCEGWSAWVAVIKQLTNLQVLDLTVPDSLTGSSLPSKLLQALISLPRLSHLHLTTTGTPGQLLSLTQLTGLRTLSLNYTGPPVPQDLLSQLQAGLGPSCKVQLWEMVVLPHCSSFGNEFGGIVGNAAVAAEGASMRYSIRERLKGVLVWGAMHAASIWVGWRIGARIRRHRTKRAELQQQQQQ